MINKTGLTILLGGLIVAGSAQAADPTPAMLANACGGCHGTNGASAGPATPTIAGMSSEYFVMAMQAYKKGEWPSTVMTRIAKGYSDAELEAMGQFFAKQPYVVAHQTADAAKAKTGAKLHAEFCEGCHEKGGAEGDDAGIIAGQWMPYMAATLEDYEAGKRPMSAKMKKKMDALLQQHKKEGLDALVNFYGSAK